MIASSLLAIAALTLTVTPAVADQQKDGALSLICTGSDPATVKALKQMFPNNTSMWMWAPTSLSGPEVVQKGKYAITHSRVFLPLPSAFTAWAAAKGISTFSTDGDYPISAYNDLKDVTNIAWWSHVPMTVKTDAILDTGELPTTVIGDPRPMFASGGIDLYPVVTPMHIKLTGNNNAATTLRLQCTALSWPDLQFIVK